MPPSDRLFCLSDIAHDFQGFISRWIVVSEELRTVCNLFFGHRRSPAPYTETRFLNVAQAVEVLHRRRSFATSTPAQFSNNERPDAEHAKRVETLVDAAPTPKLGK